MLGRYELQLFGNLISLEKLKKWSFFENRQLDDSSEGDNIIREEYCIHGKCREDETSVRGVLEEMCTKVVML